MEKEKKEKTSNNKKWLILAIVCVLVLVSVGGYFIYQSMGKKDKVAGTNLYAGGEYGISYDKNTGNMYIVKGYGINSKVVETYGPVKVTFDPATAYKEKHVKFYARRIKGINEDGSFQLGEWEMLACYGNFSNALNKTLYLDGIYGEFAFSFDIKLGTDWPYSDIFWTVDKGHPKDIKIDWGGTVRRANIKITVDGTKVVDKSNCSSHKEKILNPNIKDCVE